MSPQSNTRLKNMGDRKTVTLRDIARACGVSVVTVSHALRGTPKEVGRALQDKIQATATQLGYDPAANYSARRLVARRKGDQMLNHLVGVSLPFMFNDESVYCLRLFNGMMTVLHNAQFGVLTNYTGGADSPLTLMPSFIRGEVDGVIALGDELVFKPTLEKLRALPLFADRPVVTLINTLPGCSAVLADDMAGGYLAAKHLLELGHRHLLTPTFIPAPTTGPVYLRAQGYEKALQEYGLDPHRYLHPVCMLGGLEDVIGRVLAALRATPAISGILAWNDVTAVGLYYALVNAGWRIPDDISLIGYDETNLIPDARGENILTTVAVPLYAMGQEAALQLLRQIEHSSTLQTLTLPIQLQVRGTTAPPSPKKS